MRPRRRQISSTDRASLNQEINRHVLNCVFELKISTLSAFLPFDGEPDLRPALGELESDGVRIALPVTDSRKPATMAMHQWKPGVETTENEFGIEQPVDGKQMDIAGLDLLFIPLVAWDRKGGRLGMGRGYYDRILEPLGATAHPARIGVAFGIQEVTCVPADWWDIPLHGLVYENGWISFDR